MTNIMQESKDLEEIEDNVIIDFSKYVRDVISSIKIEEFNLRSIDKDIDSSNEITEILKVLKNVVNMKYSPANTTYKSIEQMIVGRDFRWRGGGRYREGSELDKKIESLLKLTYFLYITMTTKPERSTSNDSNLIINPSLMNKRNTVLESHATIRNAQKKFTVMSELIEAHGDMYGESDMRNKMKLALAKQHKEIFEDPVRQVPETERRRTAIIITEEE